MHLRVSLRLEPLDGYLSFRPQQLYDVHEGVEQQHFVRATTLTLVLFVLLHYKQANAFGTVKRKATLLAPVSAPLAYSGFGRNQICLTIPSPTNRQSEAADGDTVENGQKGGSFRDRSDEWDEVCTADTLEGALGIGSS